MSLFSIIKKNIVMLVRAKSSALIVILGPLIVILLAGLAFDNTNTYAVKIGTYSSNYNQLSNSFVERLSQNQFGVTRYPTEELCTQGIKTGNVHTCVVFSPDFALSKNLSNEINFYVDYSRLNLVWTVLEVMTQRVAGRAQELSLNLTTILLKALDFTKNEVKARRPNIITYTTLNDDAARIASAIQDDFESLDLRLRLDNTTLTNLSTAKSRVNYWLGAMKSLADRSLEQAGKGIKQAELAAQGNENVTAQLRDARRKVEEFRTELQNASGVATTEVNRLNQVAQDLDLQIQQTKRQLTVADEARMTGVENLKVILEKLDAALLQILFVQKAMNDIENTINSIEVTDPASIVQPIKTTIKPVVSEKTYLNYIFPILIVMIIMFTAVLLAPTLILLDRNSPAHFRNFLSPVRHITFMLGTFITCFSLLFLQVVVIMIIAALFFRSQVLETFGPTSLLLLLLLILFTLLGMIVGHLFRSEETATLAAVTLGSSFMFLSDVIIPIESMPPALQQFSAYNPFVLGGTLLRRAMIFNSPFSELSTGILVLLGYIVLAALLVVATEYVSHQDLVKEARKYFEKR